MIAILPVSRFWKILKGQTIGGLRGGGNIVTINRAWNRSASFKITQWLKIIPHMIRSYYHCCCINEPVIFSHSVDHKLGHRFHALLKVCSDRDDTVYLTKHVKVTAFRFVVFIQIWNLAKSSLSCKTPLNQTLLVKIDTVYRHPIYKDNFTLQFVEIFLSVYHLNKNMRQKFPNNQKEYTYIRNKFECIFTIAP